jgi:hypothetical protein
MSDNDNDIDGLLLRLSDPHHSRHRDALTALVAERDALLAWRSEMSATHAHLGKSYTMLAEECSELKQRVADLVAENRALSYNNEKLHGLLKSNPPADRDRELRERLIESALRGAGCSSLCDDAGAKALGRQAVWMVDGALAAMRKEEADGK